MTTELSHGRHHPAHAERGADLLRLSRPARSGANHLLQGDDVGADLRQHPGNAGR
jgi:hypothetical protein